MRFLSIVAKCLNNEIYSDQVVAKRLGVKGVYRPQKRYSSWIYSQPVLLIFSLVLPVLFFVKAFIFFLKTLFSENKGRCIGDFFWLSSHKSLVIYEAERGSSAKSSIPIKFADFANYLTVFDVTFSLVQVICVYPLLLYRFGISRVYYMHDLFDLATFFAAVKKIDGRSTFRFTNHYDRWSVMLSNAASCELVQYQHGVVSDSYCPPSKIKNISSVFLISSIFEDVWRENILDDNCDPRFLLARPTIRLSEYLGDGTVAVISNPMYYDRELNIVSECVISGKRVIFKPHPVYKYDLKKLDSRVEIWQDPVFAPNCELVVLIDSTLGYEYELAGKRVRWVPVNQ